MIIKKRNKELLYNQIQQVAGVIFMYVSKTLKTGY